MLAGNRGGDRLPEQAAVPVERAQHRREAPLAAA
jgi:hypothetical protein